ncbi:MAG: DegT/DnrJ/EryC1/StrS family aminotransferase [Sulfolobales archaeon]
MALRIRASMPVIDEEDISMVINVLKSGWLAYGPVVEEFEKLFAEYIGVRRALAVSSGTAALELSLRALGVGVGDEVIVPSFTFIATANVALSVGARPILCDIDLETYNIDPRCVEEKINRRTRAIIPVHLYGHPADMDPILRVAKDHGVYVVEDAAQAHGALYKGRRCGSIGDLGAFSFYATKNMTTGEGGMVTTNSDELARRIELMRNHGQESKYLHIELGWNYRMTSIQAALGISQLRKLEMLNEARRRNAERLTRGIERLGWLRPPREMPWARHVYHQYVVYLEDDAPISRDMLVEHLRRHGIEAMIHYPLPIHMQPLYRRLGYGECCPNSAKASQRVLSLPVHPGLGERDIDYIVEVLSKI